MMLAARGLAIGFPGRMIGQGIELALRPGEVLCLLGPNGVGKTTLFRTLLGMQKPLQGEIELDGRPVSGLSPAALARGIAYVPQAQTSYFPFTMRDIVLMGRSAHLRPFSAPTTRDRALAEAALERVGIGHLADAIYTRTSGGERQLCLIARALAAETALLVMDEPTASLDFGNRLAVLDEIARLRGAGMGILFSTHDPDQAFHCSDRVALLSPDGRLQAGTPEAMITRENLRWLYGVEIEVVTLPARDGALRRICLPVRRTES